jgi:hypothetical protein
MAPELKEAVDTCLTALLTAGAGIVGTLATWGLVLFRSWIKAKVASIQDKQLRAGVEHAMGRLDYIATTIVADINQRVKAARSDGKLTPEEAAKIKTIALARIKAQLPPYLSETLAGSVQDLDRYISAKIEQKFLEAKR